MSVLDPSAELGRVPGNGPDAKPSRVVPSIFRSQMPEETTWSIWWAFVRHPFKLGAFARVRNRYGVYATALRCRTCGWKTWVTPAVPIGSAGWVDCLADECEAYDPHRDASFLFKPSGGE